MRWLVVVAVAAAAVGCRPRQESAAPQQVRVLGRVEFPRGLIAFYNASLPGIQSSLQIVPGSTFVLNALKQGTAELGYAQADVIYAAYRSGLDTDPTPFTSLRAIAVVQRANAFVVVRRDSSYLRISDLAGARIGIDPSGSYGAVDAQVLLKGYGLDEPQITLSHMFPDRMGAGIKEQTLDAAVFVGAASTLVASVTRVADVRVLDVDRGRINALRARYPFINPTLIAAGDIDGQDDIHTFGVENVLI